MWKLKAKEMLKYHLLSEWRLNNIVDIIHEHLATINRMSNKICEKLFSPFKIHLLIITPGRKLASVQSEMKSNSWTSFSLSLMLLFFFAK
jgi:hypothetical protein